MFRKSLSLAACLAAFGFAAVAEVESEDPIRLTLHDWTGQLITTHLMAAVLEEAGYTVELVQADYLAQFAGLKTGDLHIAMEIWETTGREAMDAAMADGSVVSLGESGMEAIEEWWFPSYMKEKCPALPDWQALNDCAEAFSIPETAPKGRYLGGPVTWGGFDEERVSALGLNYEVIHAGTDAAMFAELESAYQRKDPILLWIYAPHWAPQKFEGEWIAFPPYTPECYTDPAWGTNPEATHDCAKPRGPIWKVAYKGVAEKWPGAAKAVENFKIDNATMGGLIAKVDLEGAAIEDVVDAWMDENEALWSGWIAQ